MPKMSECDHSSPRLTVIPRGEILTNGLLKIFQLAQCRAAKIVVINLSNDPFTLDTPLIFHQLSPTLPASSSLHHLLTIGANPDPAMSLAYSTVKGLPAQARQKRYSTSRGKNGVSRL